jgi:membrane associated rhomboid family serine protease
MRAWRAARDAFTPREPQPFTPRWAQSYDAGAPLRPITWLTSTFLHGSVDHLLGNMVFLFLFGFTLEVALGRWLYLACYLLGGVGASALAAWAYAGMGGLALGASGAISALMGMYVVLYGLRRIPFFYWVLFYFNIARWPAIVVLPVWMLTELWQHLSGGDHTAHMAHLGGFIAGALVMAALKRVRQFDLGADAAQAGQAATGAGGEDAAELERLKAKAERQTRELEFAGAARAWQQAAQLAPRDAGIAEAWFDCARHEPASEGFHAAARQVFKLPARDAATQQLQHRCYLTYLATAKPSIRLSPATLQALVRSFTAQEQWQDANNLARALLRQNPPPPGGVQAVQRLASALARAGRKEEARAWLPHLQRHAPDDEETRWLAKAVG